MEQSIEQKLRALYELQIIHTKIDKIHQVRGELPIEVRDLEDEVARLETRIKKTKSELDDLEQYIVTRKTLIQDAQAFIKKYTTQLNNVKNDREYEALCKEIEIQDLDIQVSEKKIKEYHMEVLAKEADYQKALAELENRKKDLETKSLELSVIASETNKEEEELQNKVKQAKKNIDSRLLIAYERLRKNAKNGLAVVSIQRDSCSGCFNQIPPQRQTDIRQHKKVIICEHCGRILVDEQMILPSKNNPSSS